MTCYGALEADLAHWYQLDLPDALWGPEPVSARRLGVLVRGLPAESNTMRTVAPERLWGTTDELLATLLELTDSRWGWFWDVHSKSKRPAALRIPRPGRDPIPSPQDEPGVVRHGKTTRPNVEVVAYLRRYAPTHNDQQEEEVTVDG